MARAESRAAEVLAELPRSIWDGRSLPVPVEAIADSHFRLLVCDAEDLTAIAGAPVLGEGETLSGLLLAGERQIWVNAAEAATSPGRRRFTIGHELGHWCLHADGSDRVFCRSAHVLPQTPADVGPDIEEEASLFSGSLLFPAALMHREWGRLRGDVKRLCERFGASAVATQRAVFRVIRLPEVLLAWPDATVFFWDDAGYDAWRAAHAATGYVVNEHLADPGRSRLHKLSCHYMNRAAREGQQRTQQPKWCSDDVDTLLRVFPGVARCRDCRDR